MDMIRDKNRDLFAQLSQYIEENYEGFSYRAAYHFDEATPVSCNKPDWFDDIFRDVFLRNPVAPSAHSEPDPFHDMFRDIFKLPKSDTPSTHIDHISELFEEFAREETFSEHMIRIISEKGYEETEVYHSIFMDRKLFNKIRNDPEYQPSKRTALLIAVALKLAVAETQELLKKAGFALTHCSKTDLIIEFCMQQGIYDIFVINEMLDSFRLPLLMKCD